MLPVAMAIGAGLNLLKRGGQIEQEIADRKQAAETMRWSPWTGMKPNAIREAPGAFDAMLSGAAGGASMDKMMGGSGTMLNVADQKSADLASAATAREEMGKDISAWNQMGQKPGTIQNPLDQQNSPNSPEQQKIMEQIKLLKMYNPKLTGWGSVA